MRIAFLIISMTLIAVALVHIRRAELPLRHEMQCLETQHAALRRDLWDRQMRLGYQTTPQAVQFRADAMSLDLTPVVEPPVAAPTRGH
jgi:hypothetical protein